MKFKVGDIVRPKSSWGNHKIIRIAEKGEVVKGLWKDGDTEFKVLEKSYILEDEQKRLSFSEVKWANENEEYYEVLYKGEEQ
jgi:hypothetical protein